MSKIHEVKTLPKYFWAGAKGRKPFEVRRNDRDYKVGDTLREREWSPYGGYTGRTMEREITYVLADPEYCKEGYVVLGLRETEAARRETERVVVMQERTPERHNGCDPGKKGPHGGPCPICGAPAMAQNWDPESDTCTCRACGYTF